MSKQLGKEKLCGLVTLTVGTVASVVFKRNTEIFTISYLGVFEMVLLEWNHVRKEPGAKKKKNHFSFAEPMLDYVVRSQISIK
jgi:hypothetical protein